MGLFMYYESDSKIRVIHGIYQFINVPLYMTQNQYIITMVTRLYLWLSHPHGPVVDGRL